MKKIFNIILFCFTTSSFLFSQNQKYSRVKIYTHGESLNPLISIGVGIDHGNFDKEDSSFTSEFSENDIKLIQSSGYKYDILVDDVTATFLKENAKAMQIMETKERVRASQACGTGGGSDTITPSNFKLGTMGGHFTYEEILANLDTMAKKFPNLITIKQPISDFLTKGLKPIYWVKISDNPNIDENEPEVLYNALHHAREPVSASNVIYYMYYLLENYSKKPDIKLLVDNTEMYFVLCVNPDGYITNQITNPQGGGTQRVNGNGVDLNRNYSYNWGYDNQGSTPFPSDTYRGPSAFSEQETQAMQYFCTHHLFKLVLNHHTSGNKLLYPWDYANLPTPDHSTFVNYAKILAADNLFPYGNCMQTLNYVANGDAIDWQYGEQNIKNKIWGFTPETGLSFWPLATEIISLCSLNLQMNLHLPKLATNQAFAVDAGKQIIPLQGSFKFSIYNYNIDNTPIVVSIIPLGTDFTSAGNPKTYVMNYNQVLSDTITYRLKSNLSNGTPVKFLLSIITGTLTYTDTIRKIYGKYTTLASSACNDMLGWKSTTGWNVTSDTYYSPGACITDSPGLLYNNGAYTFITSTNPLSIPYTSTKTVLSFKAKWNIEPCYDFAQLLISTDFGSTWTPLQGIYTKPGTSFQDPGMPVYEGAQSNWISEEVNLDNYAGKTVLFRFRMVSDDNAVAMDGFYFDDFKTETIDATPTATKNISLTEIGYLSQNVPNPAREQTLITYNLPLNQKIGLLKIFNSIGEEVNRIPLPQTDNHFILSLSEFKSGIYFYQLEGENGFTETRKMVVIK